MASFSFTESRVLAEVYTQALRGAGYPVERSPEAASRELLEPALEQGKVDLVPEYVGSALAFVEQGSAGRSADAYPRLQAVFAARGVTVPAPSPGQDQNGLVVTRTTAERLRLRRISDLSPVAPQLVLGGPPECPERPLCLPGLRSTYGLAFKQFRTLDASGPGTVGALEVGDVDVAVMFTTDPRLGGGDLVLLEDDRGLQPPENVVPVVRTAVVNRHGPGLVAVLDRVTARLTTDELRALNRRVALDGRSPARAAAEWLAAQGLAGGGTSGGQGQDGGGQP